MFWMHCGAGLMFMDGYSPPGSTVFFRTTPARSICRKTGPNGLKKDIQFKCLPLKALPGKTRLKKKSSPRFGLQSSYQALAPHQFQCRRNAGRIPPTVLPHLASATGPACSDRSDPGPMPSKWRHRLGLQQKIVLSNPCLCPMPAWCWPRLTCRDFLIWPA